MNVPLLLLVFFRRVSGTRIFNIAYGRFVAIAHHDGSEQPLIQFKTVTPAEIFRYVRNGTFFQQNCRYGY